MFSIIVAKDQNNAIGIDNNLPWHLPADLKHFKDITTGHFVIMGRKTYESIFSMLGKPLPNRKNIVISSNLALELDKDVLICNSIENTTKIIGNNEAFIIGGEQIYKLALPLADKLYITEVQTKIKNGNKFFPKLDNTWKEISREKHEADEKNKFAYDFVIYERK